MNGPDVERLVSGITGQAPFPALEYRERLDRIRAAMEREEIDLLYLSAPESICYVTGHEAQWYQGQAPMDWHPGSGVAIRVDEDDPIHFEDEDEAVLARLTSVPGDLRVRPHGDATPPWASFVTSELEAAGWLKGTVGLETWSSRPNRGYSEMFQAALESKGPRVVDATKLVRGVRAIKSAQEMECVRQAQQVADVGMQAVIETMRPGMTELEVYGEVVSAMTKAGGETAGVPALVASGPRSACVHALPSRRVIAPGDIVNIDICGVYKRYHASLARCVSMGQPSHGIAVRVEQMARGTNIVADLIRPGLPIRQLLRAVEEHYREVGIWEAQWWIGGYELGIAFPPDTVGEFYYEVGMDPGDAAFPPGMACNFESNFYLPEDAGVAVQTSTMAFTDTTAGFLFATPPDLIVLE